MQSKAEVEQAEEEVGAAERAEQEPVEAGSQRNLRRTRMPTTQPEQIARRGVVKIGAYIPQQHAAIQRIVAHEKFTARRKISRSSPHLDYGALDCWRSANTTSQMHAILKRPARGASSSASVRAKAIRPHRLAEHLIEGIRVGHDQMPVFDFDIRTTDALVAYIKSIDL